MEDEEEVEDDVEEEEEEEKLQRILVSGTQIDTYIVSISRPSTPIYKYILIHRNHYNDNYTQSI